MNIYTYAFLVLFLFFKIILAGQFQVCLYTCSGKSKRPRQIYDPNPWGAPTGAQKSMRNLSSGSYVIKRQNQPIWGTLSTPPPPLPPPVIQAATALDR